MTKFVYAAPDISPDVYTPPRGVVMLPISEHPTIKALTMIEKMPPASQRLRGLGKDTQAMMIAKYFREHPPADAYTIAAALGLNWESVKRVLLENPNLFKRIGTIQVRKANRVVWGLVDDDAPVVVPAQETPPRRPGRPQSDDKQLIADYLRSHGPATNQAIADALGLDRQQVKRALERGLNLFRVVGRVDTDNRGGKLLLWGLVGV